MNRRRKRLSKSVRAYRFVCGHPILILATCVAIGTGIGVHHWLDVSNRARGATALCAFFAVFIIYVLAVIGYGAIYIVMGIHPLTGTRTILYVGLTTQKPQRDRNGKLWWPRIEQHLFGSEYYGLAPKPWADTVTDWHFTHESWWFFPPLLRLLEELNIKWRKPLYNYVFNLQNPRRIDMGANTHQQDTQLYQRNLRDHGIYTAEYATAAQRAKPSFSPWGS